MKKTLLATLLTLVLALSCAFGLAACNDDNSNDNNGGDDNNPPTGSQTVEVTGVEIDESTWMLEVGKTKQLTATVAPANATDKSVTWISSNPEVARVSSAGLVTGVAPGSNPVTITAKTANNKTATCLVTVVAASTGGDQPGASQTATLIVGFNQLEVSKNGTTCKLTVDITGNYTFTLSTDPDNKFIVTIGTQEPETYENGDIVTLPLNKGVEVEFTIAAHADNKDGNLSLNIVSETKPLGYAGMIQVSSRNNSDAITEGYIEVLVAVLEAGDYTLTGGVTGGEVTVYMNGSSRAIGSSENGELNIDLSGITDDELDENGAIKFKFTFDVTSADGFVFWAMVDVAEEGDDDVVIAVVDQTYNCQFSDGSMYYLSFTPDEGGTFKITAVGDAYLSVMEDNYPLDVDGNQGDGENAEITVVLEAGHTYLIECDSYSYNYTDSFTIIITSVNA